MNDDYEDWRIQHGSETKLSTKHNVDFGKTPLRQKLIHEQDSGHHFIAGHSSYALLRQPGDAPFFWFTPPWTCFECIYKEPDSLLQRVLQARPGHSAIHSGRREFAGLEFQPLGQWPHFVDPTAWRKRSSVALSSPLEAIRDNY
jgi:hypothetical protein